jgi:hypothetical protein
MAQERKSHQQDVADSLQRISKDILNNTLELENRGSDLLDRYEALLARFEKLVQRFEASDPTNRAIREERGGR